MQLTTFTFECSPIVLMSSLAGRGGRHNGRYGNGGSLPSGELWNFRGARLGNSADGATHQVGATAPPRATLLSSPSPRPGRPRPIDGSGRARRRPACPRTRAPERATAAARRVAE